MVGSVPVAAGAGGTRVGITGAPAPATAPALRALTGGAASTISVPCSGGPSRAIAVVVFLGAVLILIDHIIGGREGAFEPNHREEIQVDRLQHFFEVIPHGLLEGAGGSIDHLLHLRCIETVEIPGDIFRIVIME